MRDVRAGGTPHGAERDERLAVAVEHSDAELAALACIERGCRTAPVPGGPNHVRKTSGVVHAAKTRSHGALNVRRRTSAGTVTLVVVVVIILDSLSDEFSSRCSRRSKEPFQKARCRSSQCEAVSMARGASRK